jgi:hypothetical protein
LGRAERVPQTYRPNPPVTFRRRFLHSLLAVLIGNAVYFGFESRFPPAARHTPYQIDVGLVVAFWFCLAAWGLLAFIPYFRAKDKAEGDPKLRR